MSCEALFIKRYRQTVNLESGSPCLLVISDESMVYENETYDCKRFLISEKLLNAAQIQYGKSLNMSTEVKLTELNGIIKRHEVELTGEDVFADLNAGKD